MGNEKSQKRPVYRWVSGCLFWLYLAALFTGTHLPPKEVDGIVVNDKLLHFGAYLGLAFLWLCWVFTFQPIKLTSYIVCVIVLSLYGAFDEITQLLVDRNANMIDWYADVGGIIAGCHCFWIAHSLFRIVSREEHDTETQSIP